MCKAVCSNNQNLSLTMINSWYLAQMMDQSIFMIAAHSDKTVTTSITPKVLLTPIKSILLTQKQSQPNYRKRASLVLDQKHWRKSTLIKLMKLNKMWMRRFIGEQERETSEIKKLKVSLIRTQRIHRLQAQIVHKRPTWTCWSWNLKILEWEQRTGILMLFRLTRRDSLSVGQTKEKCYFGR